MSVENPLENFNRYIPELKSRVEAPEKSFITLETLNFMISKPVGDLIFKAVVLAKFSFKSRKMKPLTEEQLLTKKGLKKELCKAVLRASLVAATIITTVGILIGATMISTLTGSAMIGFAIAAVGLIGPSYIAWKKDPQTAYGVIDVANVAMTAHSFFPTQSTAITNFLFRLLVRPDQMATRSNWVDEQAAKMTDFKVFEEIVVQ